MQTIRAKLRVSNPVVLRNRKTVTIIARADALATAGNKPTYRFYLRRQFRIVWPDGTREKLALDVYHPAPSEDSYVGAGGSARPGAPVHIRSTPYKEYCGRGRLVRGGKPQYHRTLKEKQAWAGIGTGRYTNDGEIVMGAGPSIAPEPNTDAERAILFMPSAGRLKSRGITAGQLSFTQEGWILTGRGVRRVISDEEAREILVTGLFARDRQKGDAWKSK